MYNFPIPDLAVGRLVETATEASGMIDAYTATTNGVVPTPTTSLVTGYDFFRDGAGEVQSNLDLGIGHGGDALLADNHFNVPAPGAWTGAQMKTAVTGSRHDLIFMGGHFTANTAIAADFQTTMSVDGRRELRGEPPELDRVQRGLPQRLQPARRRPAEPGQPAARLGPGVLPQGGDAHRRHRLPVR